MAEVGSSTTEWLENIGGAGNLRAALADQGRGTYSPRTLESLIRMDHMQINNDLLVALVKHIVINVSRPPPLLEYTSVTW